MDSINGSSRRRRGRANTPNIVTLDDATTIDDGQESYGCRKEISLSSSVKSESILEQYAAESTSENIDEGLSPELSDSKQSVNEHTITMEIPFTNEGTILIEQDNISTKRDEITVEKDSISEENDTLEKGNNVSSDNDILIKGDNISSKKDNVSETHNISSEKDIISPEKIDTSVETQRNEKFDSSEPYLSETIEKTFETNAQNTTDLDISYVDGTLRTNVIQDSLPLQSNENDSCDSTEVRDRHGEAETISDASIRKISGESSLAAAYVIKPSPPMNHSESSPFQHVNSALGQRDTNVSNFDCVITNTIHSSTSDESICAATDVSKKENNGHLSVTDYHLNGISDLSGTDENLSGSDESVSGTDVSFYGDHDDNSSDSDVNIDGGYDDRNVVESTILPAVHKENDINSGIHAVVEEHTAARVSEPLDSKANTVEEHLASDDNTGDSSTTEQSTNVTQDPKQRHVPPNLQLTASGSYNDDYYIPGIHKSPDITEMQRKSQCIPTPTINSVKKHHQTGTSPQSSLDSSVRSSYDRSLSLKKALGPRYDSGSFYSDTDSDTCSTLDMSFNILTELGINGDLIGIKEDHFSTPEVCYEIYSCLTY